MRIERVSDRPRIAVSWIRPEREDRDRYLRSVRAAKGEPIPLSAWADSWRDKLSTVQGLVLTGGVDVDPRLYGQPVQESTGMIPLRDELEIDALRYCLERDIPVLAICRGLQLLNVAFGGSLIQDIPREVGHRTVGHTSSYHPIDLLPDTALASILGCNGTMQVNSRHHQGLTQELLAPGLRISAVASDGIVEGLETADGSFLVAVQCHPERMEETPDTVPLFTALVKAARTL